MGLAIAGAVIGSLAVGFLISLWVTAVYIDGEKESKKAKESTESHKEELDSLQNEMEKPLENKHTETKLKKNKTEKVKQLERFLEDEAEKFEEETMQKTLKY